MTIPYLASHRHRKNKTYAPRVENLPRQFDVTAAATRYRVSARPRPHS